MVRVSLVQLVKDPKQPFGAHLSANGSPAAAWKGGSTREFAEQLCQSGKDMHFLTFQSTVVIVLMAFMLLWLYSKRCDSSHI